MFMYGICVCGSIIICVYACLIICVVCVFVSVAHVCCICVLYMCVCPDSHIHSVRHMHVRVYTHTFHTYMHACMQRSSCIDTSCIQMILASIGIYTCMLWNLNDTRIMYTCISLIYTCISYMHIHVYWYSNETSPSLAPEHCCAMFECCLTDDVFLNEVGTEALSACTLSECVSE